MGVEIALRRLLIAAALAAFLGAGLVFLWADTGNLAARLNAIRRVAGASLNTGPWGWVTRSAAVASGLALVLTGLRALLDRGDSAPGHSFDPLGAGNVRQHVKEVGRRVRECLASPPGDVIHAFDEVVRGAIAVRASDIHMSPSQKGFRMTYRVHGTLYEIAELDPALGPRLTTRVKVLARLNTYVHNTPQDGRLVMTVDGLMVEARVSTLPTEAGERIVLRLVRGGLAIPDLGSLGFSDEVLHGLNDLLAKPQGLVFLSAPVGSGKTTTLYAALKHIAESRGRTTSLVTLEDPIEIELGFATQTQMHPRSGMTFASTLRSVLRQDPNVLMVGEIRDHETAEIAMQAGLTGHLILTTVHGDTAAGPFARLMDMNVEPFILASAAIGCLSQRLVRVLCINCRRAAEPEPMLVDRFRQHGIELPPRTYYEAVGCDFCEGQGFTGRRPIAELLTLDSKLRAAINERSPTRVLHELAVEAGMTPLLLDGLARAVEGETSLAEVLRVAG